MKPKIRRHFIADLTINNICLEQCIKEVRERKANVVIPTVAISPHDAVIIGLSFCGVIPELLRFKRTVSRDNLYSTFFINHILLVLQEVLYEDLIFCRGVIQSLRNLAGVGYTDESGLPCVTYAGESGLTGVGNTG